MNYAANIVSIIESVVNQMTPTLTISGVTTNSATSWTVEVCKTYWVHLGQRLTIDGNNYTVTEFESDTNITLKGTVSPGLVSFQLDAPDFWHGSHRKVESERARKKDVTRPVVYLPNTRTTQPGEYDSDIAYTASVRPIFLLNYLKKFDTTELQQSKVIDPAHQMADLFYSIIENDDRFNDPENLRRLEWMNFGDSTTWGNDELIFDQPLSGVELQLDLDVLIYSFCECDDQGEPEICPDVTTTFNGTATGVDTAAGQNIAIEVVDDMDTPTGTLTTNTANTKKIVVTGGGPAAPVGIELNGVTPLTDAASGTTRNFDFFDEEDNVITPTVDTDTPTNTGLLFSDVPMSFNGSATAGALVGGSKSITVQDTDGTQVGTVINDEQANLTVEVAKPGINVANLFKTGLTTSVRTGDDGDLENGRGLTWFTLDYTNPYGHSFRFCGNTGGYTDGVGYFDLNGNATSYALAFPDDECMDWAYYDQVNGTVPMWYLLSQGTQTPVPALPRGGQVRGKSIFNGIDEAVASTQNGYSDWYLPNVMEWMSIVYFEQNINSNQGLNYLPFEYNPSGRTPSVANWRVVLSTTNLSRGYIWVADNGSIVVTAPTTASYTYFILRKANIITDLGL